MNMTSSEWSTAFLDEVARLLEGGVLVGVEDEPVRAQLPVDDAVAAVEVAVALRRVRE